MSIIRIDFNLVGIVATTQWLEITRKVSFRFKYLWYIRIVRILGNVAILRVWQFLKLGISDTV